MESLEERNEKLLNAELEKTRQEQKIFTIEGKEYKFALPNVIDSVKIMGLISGKKGNEFFEKIDELLPIISQYILIDGQYLDLEYHFKKDPQSLIFCTSSFLSFVVDYLFDKSKEQQSWEKLLGE